MKKHVNSEKDKLEAVQSYKYWKYPRERPLAVFGTMKPCGGYVEAEMLSVPD